MHSQREFLESPRDNRETITRTLRNVKPLAGTAIINMKCGPVPSQGNIKPHMQSHLPPFLLTEILYLTLNKRLHGMLKERENSLKR